jgi:hypothetical protein
MCSLEWTLSLIHKGEMKGFKRFIEAGSPFYNQLLALRPRIAQAAQAIYDEWDQLEECDMGGICDEIAREIGNICVSSIHCEVTDGGHDGDDHAWIVAYNDREAYGVDIPPQVYETGGGYCWKKIPGVKFDANDVEVWSLGLSPQEIRQFG